MATEFKNQILADNCSQYNIKQAFITAHHPDSSSLVERTKRKVLEILRHLAGHLHETWEDWLSQVAASINGSVNSSTGKTPHYIILGMTKDSLMTCSLNLPPLYITLRIIPNYSSTASRPFMPLFEKN